MATKLPLIDVVAYDQIALKANLAAVNDVIKQYGQQVQQISTLTGVPEEVIYSFVFVESAGDEKAGSGIGFYKGVKRSNSNYVGFMQIDGGTATVEVFYAIKEGRMSPALQAVITSIIGPEKFKCISLMKNENFSSVGGGKCKFITRTDLLNSPILNLICGALYIKRLSNRYTENGSIRYDKVIVAYNRGSHIEQKVFPMKNLSPKQVYDGLLKSKMNKSMAKITQDYIAKIAGKNGMLTVLTAQV